MIAAESNLRDLLQARVPEYEPHRPDVADLAAAHNLDAEQTRAAAAVASTDPLVVVEGAAGAGKTTMLSSAIEATGREGRRVRVVAPTKKAADVARTELGVPADSVAALVYAHGWRWNADGVWTRLAPGETDPDTGGVYDGPAEATRLVPDERAVVDEAEMLDQDTAIVLLTVTAEAGATVALVGECATPHRDSPWRQPDSPSAGDRAERWVRRPLGLRRALGATRGQVRLQLLSEAILLVLLGGGVGVITGALATAVYAHTKHWAVVGNPRRGVGRRHGFRDPDRRDRRTVTGNPCCPTLTHGRFEDGMIGTGTYDRRACAADPSVELLTNRLGAIGESTRVRRLDRLRRGPQACRNSRRRLGSSSQSVFARVIRLIEPRFVVRERHRPRALPPADRPQSPKGR